MSTTDKASARLAILCVNYNSAGLIRSNFDRRMYSHVSVYIADNWSSENARGQIREVCTQLGFQLIEFQKNVGFGEAINALAAEALRDGNSHLLLQNPDAQIDAEQTEVLLRYSIQHPNAIVSPTIVTEAGQIWFEGAELDLRAGIARHKPWDGGPDWLTAACLLIPVTIWRELGGFSARYFLYWEDVDLTFRWKQRGGALSVLPARAVHAVGATQKTGSAQKSPLYAYYNSRNRLLFAGRNLGFRDLIRWLFTQRGYVRELFNRQGAGGRRARARYGRAAIFGSIAGAFLGLVQRAKRLGSAEASEPRYAKQVHSQDQAVPWSQGLIEVVNPRPRLFAFPYYADNPWQSLLYSSTESRAWFEIVRLHSLETWPLDERVLPGDVFHINWTAPVSQNASCERDALENVELALSRLRGLQASGVKLLWTVHNRLPHECPFPGAEIAFASALGDIADVIMVMNPNTPELVADLYQLPKSKVWNLPHSSYLGSIPAPSPDSQIREELGLNGTERILLSFGEVRPYKQVGTLISAFREANQENARLVIAGSPSGGENAEHIRGLCARDPRIILRLERQSEEEAAELFSIADLLVQSYSFGLNSGVAALAASYGCPVAVSPGPETAPLRLEPWVIGMDLSNSSNRGEALSRALVWALEGREKLRASALTWAAAHSPAKTSDEFADGLLKISRNGEV